MNLETDRNIDDLSQEAIFATKQLINSAEKVRTNRDSSNRKMFRRMLRENSAIGIVIALSDEVLRIKSKQHAAKILYRETGKATIKGFGLLNFVGLKLAGISALIYPKLILNIVMARVKQISRDIILSSNENRLKKHIENRSQNSTSLNINVLGEAVLGENEAERRFNKTIEMMKRDEVNYVSVKITSICSQIVASDHEGTVVRVVEKLRELYKISKETNTFVNLDMEEFQDLRVTVDAFKILLSEKPFQDIYAGIVLQAYLPEAHTVYEELLSWAKKRNAISGGKIKIRLVKGANLAMEKVEAELEGWSSATYPSKELVDASYLRLVDIGLRKEYKGIVDLGIASHNLFHLFFALEVAQCRGVLEQMDIEMLEGMANAESLLLASKYRKILLYTPVTEDNDFASAVAYLVRRFDENTSPENYLAASFSISDSEDIYLEQESRFLKAVKERHSISTNSIRHTRNKHSINGEFINASSSDMTNPKIRKKIEKEMDKVLGYIDQKIPLSINGKEILDRESIPSGEPNNEGKEWYSYSISTKHDIEDAFNESVNSITEWNSLGAEEIGKILNKASKIMQEDRSHTIAVMAKDAGKTIHEADIEVSEAIDFANYYGYSAIENRVFEKSSPLGVVVVVPPWNFPYAIPAGGICAALASGNSVIVKPAPETVATAWYLVQQLWKAGVPKGVLQFLPTKDDEIGQTLVTHKEAKAVLLTGSFETAKLFTNWKPEMNIMAETSGKNSIIITACADVDLAVSDLVSSAFGHSGQKCSAASIAIVDKSVLHDSNFIYQLKDATESLSTEPSWKLSSQVGPIILPPNKKLQKALHHLEKGEEWLVIPKKLDKKGYLWSPGIKIGVRPSSWSHQNEWFGPVLGVVESENLNTSIQIQNGTDYGLTAGIHSLDVEEIEKWIDSTQAGNLYINRGITGAVVNRQPFGGWKNSSCGVSSKAGGENYLINFRDFEDLKDVHIAIKDSEAWLTSTGTKVTTTENLNSERNYLRYKKYQKPILVITDSSTPDSHLEYLNWLKSRLGSYVEIRQLGQSKEKFYKYERVRWLVDSQAPYGDGIEFDLRKITQRGDIEIRRWFVEQTISITNHRYGNINAGPKPEVKSELESLFHL